MEVYKDIVGFNGFYQVSNWGKVKSLSRIVNHAKKGTQEVKERILKFDLRSGYPSVTFYKDKKSSRFTVHHLVMLAFIGERPIGFDINHKDGDKTNNHLSNLEYCTRSKNIQHAFSKGLKPIGQNHHKTTLTTKEVISIYELKHKGMTQKIVSEKYGVDRTTIGNIWRGKTWSNVTNVQA